MRGTENEEGAAEPPRLPWRAQTETLFNQPTKPSIVPSSAFQYYRLTFLHYQVIMLRHLCFGSKGMQSSVSVSNATKVKVADEVWIATALLHREHADQNDFSIDEIVERARREKLSRPLRPGVYVHVVQHCVANRPPNPGRYRMLFETAPGRRRLYRPGDAYYPDREGYKSVPERGDLPAGYSGLLTWYLDWCTAASSSALHSDPLLSLAGSGKELWARESADDYVRRLREGWQ